jgi:hypothetical protein
MLILANVIWTFHVLVILIVLILPFTNIPALLLLHSVFSASLLTHWYHNSDLCSLTLMESKLRGIPVTDSFSHQFISPLYNISQKSWSKICYILVVVLSSISFYKFLNSKGFKECLDCFRKDKSPFLNKLQCFLPVLII